MELPICKKNSGQAVQYNLWGYCVSCFEQARYRDICLQLQDMHDLYIDDLLFVSWFCLFSDDHSILVDMINQGAIWHDEVILPLRRVRYYLADQKDDQQVIDFKAGVRQQELMSEKILLEMYQQKALRYFIENDLLPDMMNPDMYQKNFSQACVLYWHYRHKNSSLPAQIHDFQSQTHYILFGELL